MQIDLTNQKFGRLTVQGVSRVEERVYGSAIKNQKYGIVCASVSQFTEHVRKIYNYQQNKGAYNEAKR